MTNEQARQIRIKLYIILLIILAFGMISSTVKGDMYYFNIDNGPDLFDVSGNIRNIDIYDKNDVRIHLERMYIGVNANGTIQGSYSGYCVENERSYFNVRGSTKGSFRNGNLILTFKFLKSLKMKDFTFRGKINKDGIINGNVSGTFKKKRFTYNTSWQSRSKSGKWSIELKLREVGANERTHRATANGVMYINISGGMRIKFLMKGTIYKDRKKYFLACQAKDKAVLYLYSQEGYKMTIRIYQDTITSISGRIWGRNIMSRNSYTSYKTERIEKPFMEMYAGDDKYNTNVREILEYIDKYYSGYYH